MSEACSVCNHKVSSSSDKTTATLTGAIIGAAVGAIALVSGAAGYWGVVTTGIGALLGRWSARD